MKGFSVKGKPVLVANVGGKYYAIGRRCTHLWGDLSKGKLEGKTVTCRLHGSRFDVTSGERLAGPAGKSEPVYAVQVEGSSIRIGI
jgi:nitrite reductase/ring-hydroxylating ferredoxin subunit